VGGSETRAQASTPARCAKRRGARRGTDDRDEGTPVFVGVALRVAVGNDKNENERPRPVTTGAGTDRTKGGVFSVPNGGRAELGALLGPRGCAKRNCGQGDPTQATRRRSQARTDGLAVGERAPPAGARGAPHEEPAERATNPARSAGEFLNEIKSSTSHQCAIHRIPADAGRVSLV
jgi:hypothetical protein